MADYYAVLNRTLAGFGDPKPQLREKLYERARSTIRRQLENRSPPLDDEMLEGELANLETAIAEIERGFSDGSPELTGDGANTDKPASATTSSPDDDAESSQEKVATSGKTPPEKIEVKGEAPAAEKPAVDRPDPPAETVAPKPIKLPVFEPDVTPPDAKPDASDIYKPRKAKMPPASDPAAEAISGWAEDFLDKPGDGQKPSKKDTSSGSEPAKSKSSDRSASSSSPGKDAPKTDELPAFSKKPDETLVIPPAPGKDSNASSKNGAARWPLLALLIVLFLGSVAAFVYWDDRETVLSSVGLGGLLGDDGIKPTPVKTITIKPDPVEEAPVSGQAEEATESAEPVSDKPKSEDRLVADPEQPAPKEAVVADPTVVPDIAPTQDGTASATETPASDQIEPAAAGDTPAVSESAILYEEGNTAADNTTDTGRVVWSKVEEPTGEGDATEPAIRARVEISERQLVMLMTIKRNSDRALPASHLIELVFAVPDDFNGGSVGRVNRYVLKENEQGRGDALVGVPARIADGIFLIALNNLDQAKATNETLLRERNWIDIPMQYRTGRRALITIEKGIVGDRVFKEVFATWENTQG